MYPKLKELSFYTKKNCLCTFTSILIVVLFVLSPLHKFIRTSLFMKLIAVLVLMYTIYLSALQIGVLQTNLDSDSEELNSQVSMNINCNYIFMIFLGLLLFFLLKSFL